MDFISKLSVAADKRILLLCFFIMLAGLFSGMFFTSMIPETEKLHLAGLLQEAMASRNLNIMPAMIYNLLLLAMIFFCGMSVYGFPLAALLFFCRSMFLGVCIPLAAGAPFVAFLPFILFNLLLLMIYLTATTLCVSYGLSRLHIRT